MQVYLGTINMFGFNYAPRGWQFCNGQILAISQNAALFSLLGTYYGGNGTSTFGLPNLQGRAAVCVGQGAGLSLYTQGQISGTETVTLLAGNLPSHNHQAMANNTDGTVPTPAGNTWAVPSADRDQLAYDNVVASTVNMAPTILAATGGNQPHNNMMPYLTVNFCIAMEGIYPTRN